MKRLAEFDKWFVDTGQTSENYTVYLRMFETWKAGQEELISALMIIRDEANHGLIREGKDWRAIREQKLLLIRQISTAVIRKTYGEKP